MVFIGILLVAVATVMSLLSGNNRSKAVNRFCNLECKQNIQKRYKFCC